MWSMWFPKPVLGCIQAPLLHLLPGPNNMAGLSWSSCLLTIGPYLTCASNPPPQCVSQQLPDVTMESYPPESLSKDWRSPALAPSPAHTWTVSFQHLPPGISALLWLWKHGSSVEIVSPSLQASELCLDRGRTLGLFCACL